MFIKMEMERETEYVKKKKHNCNRPQLQMYFIHHFLNTFQHTFISAHINSIWRKQFFHKLKYPLKLIYWYIWILILCHAVGIWRYHVGDRYTRHDTVPRHPEPWNLWLPPWRTATEAAGRLFGWAVSVVSSWHSYWLLIPLEVTLPECVTVCLNLAGMGVI